jgi:hypothetical protein
MDGPCISEMGNLSRRNHTRLREVVALRRDHQPGGANVPLAIQGENIWHEEEWQFPTLVLVGWLQD